MTQGQSSYLPKKTARRIQIIDHIMDSLLSPKYYAQIGSGLSEQHVKTFIYNQFLSDLTKLHRNLEPALREAGVKKKAGESLYWEGDKGTTVNNLLLFGVQHRPDFMVLMDDTRIAIEIKRGDSGQHVREAIGQALVYAAHFDFTCCVIVDSSKDKKIRDSLSEEKEGLTLRRLWDSFNIRISAV
jgi:hypothetical protein